MPGFASPAFFRPYSSSFAAGRCRKHRPWVLLLLLWGLGLLVSCAGRAGTAEIRDDLSSGRITPLRLRIEKEFASREDLATALNLARLYQLEGRWSKSRDTYNQALEILEEYEGRAALSLRNLTADIGSVLLSPGSRGYFGTGYERSLLHTFNALNHAMLRDFPGAAVEARKMEARQELWLQESEARLAAHLKRRQPQPFTDPDALPRHATMRDILEQEEGRALLNNYQEPFSYALSSIFNRLAGDMDFAEVSMRRAVALAPQCAALFREAWGGRAAIPPEALPDLPAIPPPPGPGYSERPSPSDPETRQEQEVTVILLSGLAPALFVEKTRLPFPHIGYIMIDLPAYMPPLRCSGTASLSVGGREFTLYPLLHTETLAYRTLRDELPHETAAAFSRAAARAGASVATGTLAASREETRDMAPLVASLTTMLLDFFSSSMADSVRNWELLPNEGSIAMGRAPGGSLLELSTGDGPTSSGWLVLPETANGVIILATKLPNASLRLDYVSY